MKRYILILVALIAGMAVHAEDLQKKALADYDNKNYAAAIDDYQQLEKQSGVSAEYYFNLGNAYYRSGKKGKAILCYERALRLNPRYEKAQANLDFVNMKIIDRPEPEENILAVGFRNVQNAMSPTAWTVVAMAAFLLQAWLLMRLRLPSRCAKWDFSADSDCWLSACLPTCLRQEPTMPPQATTMPW